MARYCLWTLQDVREVSRKWLSRTESIISNKKKNKVRSLATGNGHVYQVREFWLVKYIRDNAVVVTKISAKPNSGLKRFSVKCLL